MKRHSFPGHGGLGSGDAPKRERAVRPPGVSNTAPAGRHRAVDEPEPIRIPADWMPSDRRARRHRFARVTGKAALLVAGFGLLCLPFILNHMEKGSYYYQEVPVVVPDLPPPGSLVSPSKIEMPAPAGSDEDDALAAPAVQDESTTPDAERTPEVPAIVEGETAAP